jgi:hypothetical protein
MKFLLGIKMAENVSKGTIIYKKTLTAAVIICIMLRQKADNIYPT